VINTFHPTHEISRYLQGKQYPFCSSLSGFEGLIAVVIKIPIFCDIIPCNPLKVDRSFGGTCRVLLQDGMISQARNQHEVLLTTCFMLASTLAYSSTLNMEARCCSQTLVHFQWTTRYHPEDRYLLRNYWVFGLCPSSEIVNTRKLPDDGRSPEIQ
jgi:hypothetical protein